MSGAVELAPTSVARPLPPPHDDVLVLEAAPASPAQYLRMLWGARQLTMVLARKDFYVRYRRSWLGLFWVLLVPLVQAAVLATVFSRLARFSTGVPHYQIYVFSGFAAWSFFSLSVVAGATAVVDGKDLAARIYFPRAALPLTKMLTDLVTLLSSVVLLVVLSAAFGVHLGVNTLLLFAAVPLLLALTLGFTMVLSAVHVYFRDVRFIVGTLIMPWFYLTPVFYTSRQLQGTLHDVVRLNPVAGVIDVFRAATVGAGPDWRLTVLCAGAWAVGLIALGMELHRRLDRNLLDLM